MTKKERDEFLRARKEAGRKIDPATAEVFYKHVQVLDPYGIRDDLGAEADIGRDQFARSPGSDIWVWEGDLPEATRDALRAKPPAGIN